MQDSVEEKKHKPKSSFKAEISKYKTTADQRILNNRKLFQETR